MRALSWLTYLISQLLRVQKFIPPNNLCCINTKDKLLLIREWLHENNHVKHIPNPIMSWQTDEETPNDGKNLAISSTEETELYEITEKFPNMNQMIRSVIIILRWFNKKRSKIEAKIYSDSRRRAIDIIWKNNFEKMQDCIKKDLMLKREFVILNLFIAKDTYYSREKTS